ncbi:MAG: polyphosphate polymerase domain-containing protein [Anaerolineae bacterium]|nr:polyphosphate polymerase domain-containing protein [Anaerolineae bacterium]
MPVIDSLMPDRQAEAEPDLRYEIKMVCPRHRLQQARFWVRLHPAGFMVAHPPRQVNSLYLDTPHLRSLNDNLEGLSARRKFRLRWYGVSVEDICPSIEIKEKYNLLGRKKQTLLPCKLDLMLPWSEILKTIHAAVSPAWRALLQTVNQPTLLNRYQREYYITPDGVIRVTLDYDQVAYDQRLTSRPNLRVQLPPADAVVIEIKAAATQARRLEEITAGFPSSRSRNSKYAQGLLAALG